MNHINKGSNAIFNRQLYMKIFVDSFYLSMIRTGHIHKTYPSKLHLWVGNVVFNAWVSTQPGGLDNNRFAPSQERVAVCVSLPAANDHVDAEGTNRSLTPFWAEPKRRIPDAPARCLDKWTLSWSLPTTCMSLLSQMLLFFLSICTFSNGEYNTSVQNVYSVQLGYSKISTKVSWCHKNECGRFPYTCRTSSKDSRDAF